MEFSNELSKIKETAQVSESAWNEAISTLVLLLAPSAPHIAEELWTRMGREYSIHNQPWPKWDEALAKEEEITLVVQVNGKVRDRLVIPASTTEVEATQMAASSTRVQPYLEGKQPDKVIYVPGRLVNLVVKGGS
jgi:leucyl-tRNA synthetase